MRISLESWERARRLHRQTPVADLHLDLPGELLFRYRAGERHVIRDRYLPVWKRTGISLIGAAVYIEDEYLPEAGLRNALQQIEALKSELKELSGELCLIRSAKELECAYHKEKIGILLYLEGLDLIGGDTALLETLNELGCMGASLTWSRSNLLACGCCKASEDKDIRGGITESGWKAIEKLRQLHMFLDISHLNDDGIREVLTQDQDKNKDKDKDKDKAQIAVLATHSNARAVCGHYRNLTDEQLEYLAGRGGIVGLNACSLLTGSARSGRHLELLQQQAEYLLKRAGEKCVCLGLDLCRSYELARGELTDEKDCGHDALAGHDELVLLSAALLENGMEEKTLRGLLGQNAFAFFQRVFERG